MIGSMVVSGLMGGPIGIATNVAALAVEKATGFDPEKIGHDMLASIGIGREQPAVGTELVVSPNQVTEQPPTISYPTPWSHMQLTAYGVTTMANGTIRRGDLQGSDVLNDLELTRNGAAVVAVQMARSVTV